MKEAIYTNHSSHVSMLNSMRGKADEYVASNIRKEYSQLHQDSPLKPITGVLINSKLISDNPDLEVHVYGEEYKDNETEPDNELLIIRMERIKSSVLMILARGEIKSVTIDTPPESLHYGADWAKLFYHDGSEIVNSFVLYEKGIIDFASVSKEIEDTKNLNQGTITSAELSLELTSSEYRGVVNFGE